LSLKLLLPFLNPRKAAIQIGVCRPNLDCVWFTGDELTGAFEDGERVGVLLSLEIGSLRFFKNDEPLGSGYAAGNMEGPVMLATDLCLGASIEMLPYAEAPAAARNLLVRGCVDPGAAVCRPGERPGGCCV
jgi:hypothetical protein